MDKQGFVVIWRKILDSKIFSYDITTSGVAITCILKANWQSKYWHGRKIERGQFITSQVKFARECKLSRKQLRTVIDRLVEADFLDIKTDNKYTLFTVINYNTYQDYNEPRGQQKGQQGANEGTTKGQQGDTTKQYKQYEQCNKGNNKKSPGSETAPESSSRKPKVKKKPSYKFTEEDFQTAKLIQQAVINTNPYNCSAKDADLDKWANEIRLLKAKKKVDQPTLEKILDWVFKVKFWKTTIQSPSGLINNWDTATAQMVEEMGDSNKKKSATDVQREYEQGVKDGIF